MAMTSCCCSPRHGPKQDGPAQCQQTPTRHPGGGGGGGVDRVGRKRDGQNPRNRGKFAPSQKAPQIYGDSPTTIFRLDMPNTPLRLALKGQQSRCSHSSVIVGSNHLSPFYGRCSVQSRYTILISLESTCQIRPYLYLLSISIGIVALSRLFLSSRHHAPHTLDQASPRDACCPNTTGIVSCAADGVLAFLAPSELR